MIYALLGALFGIAGGMGLGGGIVLIPAMTLLLGVEQHTAQGMTLFAYLSMAVYSLISHIRSKSLHIKAVLWITAFGLLGGAGGYLLARAFDTRTLKTIFGAFLILAALLRAWRQEIGPRLKKRRESAEKR